MVDQPSPLALPWFTGETTTNNKNKTYKAQEKIKKSGQLDRKTGGHNARNTCKTDTPAMKRAMEKKQEETKQKCRLGTASNEITGGGGLQLVCGRPTSPLVLLWFLRRLVVWFAWKIPNSQHYLRNREIKIKTKIKQTRGLTEIATLKFWSKRNPPVKPR